MTGQRAPAPPLDDFELLRLRTVRRVIAHWPIVILCAVVATLAGYVSASRQPTVYSATSMVQLTDVDLLSVVAQLNLQGNAPDAATRADTLAKLVVQGPVLAAAARNLGPDTTAASLAGKVSASAQRKTTLIAITATDGNPRRAARIANAVAGAFVSVRRATAKARLSRAQIGLSAQLADAGPNAATSPETRQLRRRLQKIGSMLVVAGGGVDAAQPARVPSAASSPRPKRTALLAGVLGGVFGTGLALLLVLVDRRVRDEDDLADVWDAPILATVPALSGVGIARRAAPSEVLEALAIARTQLPAPPPEGRPLRLMITSATESEGKAQAAWSLAVASALAGARVAYVEADLRRPVVAEALGLPTSIGLAEALQGSATVAQVVRQVNVDIEERTVRVDVVPAGTPPAAPAALLESVGQSNAFAEISDGLDLLIIDAPAALAVADARFLARHVDGVLAVAGLGQVTRRDVTRLAEVLDGLDVPLVGVIACVSRGRNLRWRQARAEGDRARATASRGSAADTATH